MPRTWLVTGSSSGIGRAVTEAALKRGDNVIATLRKPSVLDDLVASTPSSQLLVVKCDVSITSDIHAAFAQGLARFRSIEIVLNNAGYGIAAEAESTPNEAARTMFDVNFWGAADVSREAVRVFRDVNGKEKGGWLFNVSSIAGFTGFPVIPYYSASKFALEGFTEALAKELDPTWNIKITLIELGAFRTSGQKTSLVVVPPAPAYASESMPTQFIRKFLADETTSNGDPDKAAERIADVVSHLKDSSPAEIPLHWCLGKEGVANSKTKLLSVVDELDRFEKWSENLLLTDEYKPLIL